MKVSAQPKKPKNAIAKVSKSKVVKKREKDSLVGKKKAAVLELASETLPALDRKKVAKSLKTKKLPPPEKKTSPEKQVKALKRKLVEQPTAAPLQKPLKKEKETSKATKAKSAKTGKPAKKLQKSLLPSNADNDPQTKKAPKKLQKLHRAVKQEGGQASEVGQLKRDILEGVCSSALKFVKDEQNKKSGKKLLDSDPQEILLQVQVFKVPETPFMYFRSLVPHPIYPSEPEVCLIVPDLFRGRRTDAAFAQYKETYEARLQSTGVTGINALLPFTQMRYEYRPYELKRKLVDSYDVFLCDGRIFHHCSKFFGKFMDKPFIPIHAILRDEEKKVKFSKHLQTEVDKALRRVTFNVTPYGSSFSVRHIGHSGLTSQELADNIEAVWKSLSDILPGGIGNIKAVYVKGSLTLPIPLYAAFAPPKEVPVGKFRQIPAPVEDELSTIPGRNVIVYPDGKIWYQDTQTEEDKEFIQAVMVKNKTKVAKTEDSTVKLDVDGENAEDDAGDAAGDAVGAQTERLDKQKQTAAKGSDEDTDDEYDDIAAAEEEYLQNWSESISMKELEEEEIAKKDKPKRIRKKATGKGPAKPAAKPTGRQATGISKKFVKGKSVGQKKGKKA